MFDSGLAVTAVRGSGMLQPLAMVAWRVQPMHFPMVLSNGESVKEQLAGGHCCRKQPQSTSKAKNDRIPTYI